MNSPFRTLALAGLLISLIPATRADEEISGASGMSYKSTPLSASAEPMQTGAFQPTWASLENYQVPEWYRDAKFGIWAHWGPQCQPEDGDWYARNMYNQGSGQNKYHVEHYGPPSVFGFKDVINTWKAENFDPQRLVNLYKDAGAQFFVALANHHDNFDTYDSKYQPWNATKIGPHKDLIAGWAQAAKNAGLPFGVTIHAAHAWNWYAPSQGSDKTGPLAGVPYDGKLTKADGTGKWWNGLDPQDLYAQNHARTNFDWAWGGGDPTTLPDAAYCEKFYNRTLDLINKYHPDLVYFDDTVLPLYPVSDVGLKIAAHYYNSNALWHQGVNKGVVLGKVLNADQRKAMVWDVERGTSPNIEPLPWQSETCIGNWHYDRALYNRHGYKHADQVIRIMADVVSKNGTFLLNVPVRGDGTIDDDEEQIVKNIGVWMKVNSEAIYATRPWKICGEGPAIANAPAIKAQGFNEGKVKLGADDYRFTTKGDTLYAMALGWPGADFTIKSLATGAGLRTKPIGEVTLLGSNEKLSWKQTTDGLVITKPGIKPAGLEIYTFKVN